VHGGWWDSWQEVADELSGEIENAVNQYPGYKLVFTGHSLGGALATIAATVLRNAGHTIDLVYSPKKKKKRKKQADD